MNKAGSQWPRMIRFTAVAGLLYGIGSLIALAEPASIFTILKDLGGIALLVSAAYYLFLLFKWLKRRLFWTVRNKILIAFAFVGIIPVLLLALISWISFVLVFKQVSVLYLETELQSIADTLERTNRRILLDSHQARDSSQVTFPLLLDTAKQVLAEIPPGFDRSHLLIYQEDRGVNRGSTSFYRLRGQVPEELPAGSVVSSEIPPWLRDGFDGLVLEAGRLRFEHVVFLEGKEASYLLSLRLPFDEELMDQIERRTSIEMRMTPANPDVNTSEFQLAYSDFFGSRGFFSVGWVHFFTPIQWSSGETTSQQTQSIFFSVPVDILLTHLFTRASGPGGQLFLWILVALGISFLAVELTSLLVGALIARSITHSIHDLYLGTQQIQAGKFGFQIPTEGKDQLDAVAESFNRMSESVLRLMSEVSAKEWLEREIQIAREVQAQLFPQQVPSLKGFELSATCLPARQVSGDYYDFIPHDSQRLDFVLGDISGKGISAALLMASLQSSIRYQLLYASPSSNGTGRISRAVREINRHLYRQTAAEKFSTLVLGHLDAAGLTLTYVNAGHNPPLIFSQGKVERLSTGGTVVGLFEERSYEQETFQLRPADVLVCYTDGVIEAENPSEEQFGEDRLIGLVESNRFLTADDLQALILDQVFAWMGCEEPADDLTVLVIKVTG